jgi:hypothetical protein
LQLFVSHQSISTIVLVVFLQALSRILCRHLGSE